MKKSYIIIYLLFGIVLIRVLYLNVYMHEKYLESFVNKTNIYVYGPSPKRGLIYDVSGNILVDNKEVLSIYYKNANTTLEDRLNVSNTLASILSVEEASLDEQKRYYYLTNDTSNLLSTEEEKLYEERKLTSKDIYEIKINKIDVSNYSSLDKKAAAIYLLMTNDYTYSKNIIQTNVDVKEYATIAELGLKNVYLDTTYVRSYPYNEVFRSLLGTVGPIYKEDAQYYEQQGYELDSIIGISYLEKEYENFLQGKRAIYYVDSKGNYKLIKEEENGSDIYLSIDIEKQIEIESILEEEILKAKEQPNTELFTDAYAIVSDPTTGAIIAASGKRLIDNNKSYSFVDITHTIVTSSFTMGSSIKGASISVGYNYDLIDTNKYITDSCIKLLFNPQKCSWKSLGSINDIEALKQSSNYYQYGIAINLSGNEYSYNMDLEVSEKEFDIYRDTLGEYGLGVKTQIDLPIEEIGTKGDIVAADLLLNLSIGQYDTYTPMQLMQYINTIATQNRVKPTLLSEVYNDSKELVYTKNTEVINTLTIKDEYHQRIIEGLKQGAQGGTGYMYIANKYNPAGKTGTSESFVDTNNDGQIDTKTYSVTFAGFAPVDDPKYSLVVVAPHVAVKNEDEEDTYIYRVNRHISYNITNFLFENS